MYWSQQHCKLTTFHIDILIMATLRISIVSTFSHVVCSWWTTSRAFKWNWARVLIGRISLYGIDWAFSLGVSQLLTENQRPSMVDKTVRAGRSEKVGGQTNTWNMKTYRNVYELIHFYHNMCYMAQQMYTSCQSYIIHAM